MRLSFHRLAEQEFNDAADYYERESPGLGTAFILEVEYCAAGVLAYPDAGVVVRGRIRRRLLRRFP
jgi:plasmid stabilization system protein ParE